MYKTADDFVRDEMMQSKEAAGSHKLATVTAAGPYVTFFGEDVQSSKIQKKLSSYTPVVNDTVLLANINGTYVILGKVE